MKGFQEDLVGFAFSGLEMFLRVSALLYCTSA